MALDPTKKVDVKTHFMTREGVYVQQPTLEYCRPNRAPLIVEGAPSTITPVKVSFTEINYGDEILKRICYTIGRELFYYSFDGVRKPVDLTKPLDKRTYKGVAPTCHHINVSTANERSVMVAIGFAAGQVQIIDVGAKESLQILNEERMVESSRTTCVRWLPGSENFLLASHTNGRIYCYDISKENMNVVPHYHEKANKTTDGIKMFLTKHKQYTLSPGQVVNMQPNPLFKWQATHDDSAVHQFEFSNSGEYVAIVTQEGYLRVIDHANCVSKGSMKSYFGGLLCCTWSPDDRFVVTGGEDDLVTVWSFNDQTIVARGHGHKSWVSDVAFDSYTSIIPTEAEYIKWFGDNTTHKKTEPTKQNNIKKHGFLSARVIKNLTSSSEKVNEKSTNNQSHGDHSFSEMNGRNSVTSVSMNDMPHIIYRFGSVGQDAQLCLWELTEDILYSRKRSGTVLGGFGSIHGKLHRPRSGKSSDNSKPTENNSEWASAIQYRSNASTSELTKQNATKECDTTSTKHNFFFPLSSKSETNAIAPVTTGKFATMGTRDQKKDQREHKRNLSLPHFHNLKNNSGDNSRQDATRKKEEQQVNLFGTSLCPHLQDTIMLEPLICKRISHGRLTSISFHEESFVTASQEGFIHTWSRPVPKPNQEEENSPIQNASTSYQTSLR